MERQDFYVISFENTHSAMEAQKQLKSRYSITVIPTLRDFGDAAGNEPRGGNRRRPKPGDGAGNVSALLRPRRPLSPKSYASAGVVSAGLLGNLCARNRGFCGKTKNSLHLGGSFYIGFRWAPSVAVPLQGRAPVYCCPPCQRGEGRAAAGGFFRPLGSAFPPFLLLFRHKKERP